MVNLSGIISTIAYKDKLVIESKRVAPEDKITCPFGHSNRFREVGASSTLVHWSPPSVVDGDGRVIKMNRDPNIHTTVYICFDCHTRFAVKRQYGKILLTDELKGEFE
jgi:hypothetical protein